MNRGYMLNRLKLLAVVVVVSLTIDYFQGETLDAARVLTKVLRMTVLVALLSVLQYLWTRRRHA